MSDNDTDQTSEEGTGEATSALRADLLGEADASAAVAADSGVWGVEGVPSGSALLVVTRGPNAGSRFLLDQPVSRAGRHPGSDLFLDDVTVGTPSSAGTAANSGSSTSAASTAPTSTVNPCNRQC